MKTEFKALMKWLMVPLVPALFAGSAGAATLSEWLFDQMDSSAVYNEVPGGDVPAMQFYNGAAWIATNLQVVGGPFPQSFGAYYAPNSETGQATIASTLDWSTKTNLTIEVWVKPTAYASQTDVINYRGNILRLYNNAGYYLLGFVYTSGGYVGTPFTSAKVFTNVWTHIAETFDGTTLRTYVNGVLDTNATGALPLVNNGNLYIGNDGGATYNGWIDEIRVSDVALPPGDGSGSNCLAWNKSLAIPAAKGAGYTDGTKINLSVIDGAVATNTAVVWYYAGALAGAINAQYHGNDEYAGYYGQSGSGVPVSPSNPGTWTLQLPQSYHVSHYSLTWPWSGYYPTNFVIQTSPDGIVWTDQASTNGNTATTTTGDFPDVVTKYIRVKILGLAGGVGDLWILRSARFTGSNSATVDRRISVADKNWAGASIAGSWTGVGQAIDDTVDQATVSIATADPSASPLVVKLNGQYKVDRIGIAPVNNYNYAARNIDVYTCADYGGTNWVLVKQIRDQAYTNSAGVRWPYCPYNLDKITLAARVKFHVLTNWGYPSQTQFGEVFVFPWIPPAGTRFIIR